MKLNKIYKTKLVQVNCSKLDLNYLYNCNKLSAKVWNLCLELNDKHREENDGNWISRSDLQKQTKNCVLLHAKGIQHVVHKYIFARDAMLKSKKKGTEGVKYPYREKNYFVTGWDSQSIKIDYDKNIIYLTRRQLGNKRQKPIKCISKNLPKNIQEIELVYINKLYLACKYIDKKEYKQINSSNESSIDLGEIHSITSIDNNGNAIIVTGRKIRSLKRLRNKHQAKIRNKMSRCTKGSRKYNKYLRALNRLKVKTDNQVRDCVHKITKLYLGYCLLNNISVVYYGDLDSAVRNTKKNHKGSKLTRQKLSQWNFGEIIKQLENKLSRYGIKLIKVKEYYTSQKCPNCENLNKPKKRNYVCKNCNYKQHRDIVGSINILNDNSKFHIIKYNNYKYLQIA